MSHGVMDPRHWVRRRDPMVFVELKEGDEVKEKKKRRRERETRLRVWCVVHMYSNTYKHSLLLPLR